MFNRGRMSGVQTQISHEAFVSVDNGASPQSGPELFSSVSIGPPSPIRKLLIFAAGLSPDGFYQNSGLRVNGVAASVVVGSIRLGITGGAMSLRLWEIEEPDGSTADISVEYTNTAHCVGISVYRLVTSEPAVYGSSVTQAASGSDGSANILRTTSIPIATNKPVAAVAAAFTINGGDSIWTGVQKDVGADMRSGEWFSTGSDILNESVTPHDISASDCRIILGASWE